MIVLRFSRTVRYLWLIAPENIEHKYLVLRGQREMEERTNMPDARLIIHGRPEKPEGLTGELKPQGC